MTVTATEAKERLEELLDAAAAGEPVAIVREGKPAIQMTAAPRKSPCSMPSSVCAAPNSSKNSCFHGDLNKEPRSRIDSSLG